MYWDVELSEPAQLGNQEESQVLFTIQHALGECDQSIVNIKKLVKLQQVAIGKYASTCSTIDNIIYSST